MSNVNQAQLASLEFVSYVANQDLQRQLWTAMPGIIQSFDPVALTAVVQPAIQLLKTDAEVKRSGVNMPLLLDCPVVFPRGGNCSLTFPIRPGDECLVVFAARCIDAWWQSGGVQLPMEMRMHDLSDGFVLPGPYSQPQVIPNVSTSAVQLRSDDGKAFVEINPASHGITATTPTTITANAETVTANATTINGNASGSFNVTAPTINLTGNVNISGTLSQGNGTSSFNGNMSVTGDVKANNISLVSHVHSGVQGGPSNTGTPV